MTDFTHIASKYENDALVQRSAADELFAMARIRETDDVLDLGCGTGHLTRKIRSLTKGRVVGIDAAQGMIEEARKKNVGTDISFSVASAMDMPFSDAFDLVFCNSVFQWFKDPVPALEKCLGVLRKNGRMVIQAPATRQYSPNFLAAMDAVALNAATKDVFSRFASPWLFLDTPEEYARLFEKAGFNVADARIERMESRYSPEEVYRIFHSGAAAGYLNPRCYGVSFAPDYPAKLGEIVREAFEQQADRHGKVDLVFHRIFLLAEKDV